MVLKAVARDTRKMIKVADTLPIKRISYAPRRFDNCPLRRLAACSRRPRPGPPPRPAAAAGQSGGHAVLLHLRHQIYSLGAQLCVANGNAGMRCVTSEGSKSDGRAFWSFDSKEWPLTPGLRCGAGP
jgi:hypothetical protein